MTRFSTLGLPLLLCSVPLVLTLVAWQLGRRVTPHLSSFRLASFRAGVVISLLSTMVTMSCWIDPYPLVGTSDGGYSIAWLDLAWKVAFSTAAVSIILALFGRSWPRILLIVSSIVSLFLTFGSLLQNGV
jgi:hypothetical protein